MDSTHYTSPPPGVHRLDLASLDLRPDNIVDAELREPPPVTSVKNIWFFWHSGLATMHGYSLRTARAWHRRFSKSGWTIRVLDRVEGSPLNISKFLDINDPKTFPQAFRDGTLGGMYANQHTSDLVRWPLLLRYGGIYADVGLMQIGDLDALWNRTVGDPASGYEILSYNNGLEHRSLTNYFMGCLPGNVFFQHCHDLLLHLWAQDGGKTSTDGMHTSPLLEGSPRMEGSNWSITEPDGTIIGSEEVSRMLADYIIQGQVMTLVMGLVDSELNWNGPEYVARHIYATDMWPGSQLINELTSWDGRKAFELMSLALPKDGEEESEEQRQAMDIVQQCLRRSFGFKLAHGLILRVYGETLGSNWRKHEGSDDVPGTYAHLLRYGMVHWCQDEPPPRLDLRAIAPYKVGPLLR